MKKAKSSAASGDRISELPDEIIHDILVRLQFHQLAARTSILSKRWLRLWSTFPFVEFKAGYWRNTHSRLKSFAAATSKRLLAAVPPLPLDSFTIKLEIPGAREQVRQVIHQLLSSVAGGRSSPIRVVIDITSLSGGGGVGFIEGGMLLNFRRTRFLELKGFDLSKLQSSELDNLQELSLEDVRVSRQSFPSFLANAPRLKVLRLERISEIDNTLDISASNFPSSALLLDSLTINLEPNDNLRKGLYQLLSSVSIGVKDGGRSSPVKIAVKNKNAVKASLKGGMLFTCGRTKFLDLQGLDLSRLHSFKTCLDNLLQLNLVHVRVSKKSFPSCLANAPRLEKLKLECILGINRLDILDSNFPSLESLDFVGYGAPHCLHRLGVSSGMIRELKFSQSSSKMEFEIDTPNLATLTIKTVEHKINPTVVNVPPSCQCVFACHMSQGWITTGWFIELRKCLTALATHLRKMVFELDISNSTKVLELDLSKVGHESAPLAVRHLLMGIDLRSTFSEALKPRLLDGLLWTLHPKTLSVAVSHSDNNLSSYISEQIEIKNLEKCCSNCKCWRHQFKDAKITSVTVDDISTIHESTISQPSIDMIFVISIGRIKYDYW